MAGKKGRSGRRTKYEEVHVNELAGMSVRWGIDHWKNLPDSEKMRVLISLGPRYVVQKLEGEGFDTNIYNFLRYLESTQRNNREDLPSSLALDSGDGVDKG